MKQTPLTAAYGSWTSPISAASLTEKTVQLNEPRFDGEVIYWLESRPQEKGRNALVRLRDGVREDLLPAPASVRTRAYEYGGGNYTVHRDFVYLMLDADQRLYRLDTAHHTLQPLSPEGQYCYADFCVDEQRQQLICVREDHSQPGQEPVSAIVALPLDASLEVRLLVSGADFYSNPRLSPGGTSLSWLSWQHPQMPWDGTECFIADFTDDNTLSASKKIAGSEKESIFQPEWSPEGDLFLVSDKNNWWNVYCWAAQKNDSTELQALYEMEAEFATPRWVFGMSTFGFLSADTLLCCYSQQGRWHLAYLDLPTKNLRSIPCDLTDISAIHCCAGKALLLGGNPQRSTQLYVYDHANESLTPLAQSAQQTPDTAYLAQPQAVSFPTQDQEIAHGFYYPPHNPEFIAPVESKPPLIVMCHGGPTAATSSILNLKIQFWTSRGFAVLDVNYRGSTGYGRQYRDRLKHNWGVTDVIDVCSGADFLITQGLVDENKLAIRGSSAGGYTALAALTFSKRFTAGASLYGIGNLETLTQDTHKFEARYLDNLIGTYPQEKALYLARSPLCHIDQLQCPVIFLQGLQDKVVPPNQAEAMVKALTAKGIPNAYITFPEEAHGFRQAHNIQRAIEAELFFYSKIFGFALAESISPIHITHLEH